MNTSQAYSRPPQKSSSAQLIQDGRRLPRLSASAESSALVLVSQARLLAPSSPSFCSSFWFSSPLSPSECVVSSHSSRSTSSWEHAHGLCQNLRPAYWRRTPVGLLRIMIWRIPCWESEMSIKMSLRHHQRVRIKAGLTCDSPPLSHSLRATVGLSLCGNICICTVPAVVQEYGDRAA